MNVTSRKQTLSGFVTVPGSKSHTIRSVLFAALASGTSTIRNPLPSADALSCMNVIQAFGASVTINDGLWTVTAPKNGLSLPSRVVDVGNSGSVLYFMTPIAATISGWTVLTGDSSICTRPIQALLDALIQLGGEGFTTRPSIDAPPVVVKGPFQPGKVTMEGNLSQYVSGILMAAPRLNGTTSVFLTNPKEKPFLKMTCEWLESVGVGVTYNKDTLDYFEITGPQTFNSFDKTVPSDWEGVAFPLVAAIITGSHLEIKNVDCSGSQGDEAIVDVLRDMGGDIVLDIEKETLIVNGSSGGKPPVRLRGGEFNCAGFPDALPSLAVAACFAEGDTRLVDVGVCRLKETDRITLMKKELEKLGASLEEGPDWLLIRGRGGKGLHGGTVDSYDDHRIAMALAVAGLAIEGDGVVVKGAECASISFPHFYETLNGVGARFVCN